MVLVDSIKVQSKQRFDALVLEVRICGLVSGALMFDGSTLLEATYFVPGLNLPVCPWCKRIADRFNLSRTIELV